MPAVLRAVLILGSFYRMKKESTKSPPRKDDRFSNASLLSMLARSQSSRTQSRKHGSTKVPTVSSSNNVNHISSVTKENRSPRSRPQSIDNPILHPPLSIIGTGQSARKVHKEVVGERVSNGSNNYVSACIILNAIEPSIFKVS